MADWSVNGMVLIACNCDWGCPCNFNALPSRGFCQGGWCWSIEDGDIGGVGVGGLSVSLWSKWPGAIHHGNGQAVAFVDDRADERQRAALSRMLRGELGGPWGVFMNTYHLDGPHAAAHRIEGTGYETRLRVGDVVQLQLAIMRNPVTQAEMHPEVVLPEGLVVKRAAVATSSTFTVDASIAYDHAGQYTAFGRFSYQGTA